MGRLLHFFTRDDGVAPERHSTADSEPLATAPIYVIRDAGIVIDLAYDPVGAPHPARHAVDLLHHLMRDEDFAGQLAAEKAIKKYYVALCRTKGTKTFPWLSVARPLNRVLRLVVSGAAAPRLRLKPVFLRKPRASGRRSSTPASG